MERDQDVVNNTHSIVNNQTEEAQNEEAFFWGTDQFGEQQVKVESTTEFIVLTVSEAN